MIVIDKSAGVVHGTRCGSYRLITDTGIDRLADIQVRYPAIDDGETLTIGRRDDLITYLNDKLTRLSQHRDQLLGSGDILSAIEHQDEYIACGRMIDDWRRAIDELRFGRPLVKTGRLGGWN